MPQMAPYNWLYLHLMFNFILMLMIVYIYFLTNNKLVMNDKKYKKNKFIWKW